MFGKTKEEHDVSLRKTLELLFEKGARLNRAKCLSGENKMSFLGHVFGEKSISPETKKIEAIKNTGPSASIGELRSFLGMTLNCIEIHPKPYKHHRTTTQID